MREYARHAVNGKRGIVDRPHSVDESVDVRPQVLRALCGPAMNSIDHRADSSATIREFLVVDVARPVLATHADPDHAKQHHAASERTDRRPMTHVAAIEIFEEREGRHNKGFAESRIKPGEAG